MSSGWRGSPIKPCIIIDFTFFVASSPFSCLREDKDGRDVPLLHSSNGIVEDIGAKDSSLLSNQFTSMNTSFAADIPFNAAGNPAYTAVWYIISMICSFVRPTLMAALI